MQKRLLTFCLIISAFYASAQTEDDVQLDSAFFYKQLHSFAKGNNYRRFRFIKKYTKRSNLNNLSVKTQGIDWLGLYRNVIVEKKGETDSVVYVVCHYDKIDGNLIAFPNLLINGSLDILLSNIYLSKGAYDNGTGVVSSMALMQWINNHQTKYTYRFLFAGMEEYGLRGSRRHVSSISQRDWQKCVYAINIDMIASKKLPVVTITETVSDRQLTSVAWKLGFANKIPVVTAPLPKGALSDFYSFKGQSFSRDIGISFMANIFGMFIPQRSYFTRYKHPIPVVNFSDDVHFGTADAVSILSPISFGTVHSVRDRYHRVSYNTLAMYSEFFRLYIEKLDGNASFKK